MAVGRDGTPGSAGLHLAAGVPLLHPGEQVFAAMLEGWRAQQLARNLALATAGRREAMVRAFAAHADAFPWQWGPQMLDEWLGELRGVKRLRRSTVRAYASSVSAFCRYATDPAYGWAGQCQARFGTHPVQVVHEWNTAVHVQASEADPRKRAFTLDELQALFDHADEQVGRVRGGGRKGWLPVFRDAAALKVAYGFGLRRTEAAMLDVADFGPNPHALEFGEYGMCQVRFGKAMKGSPPKHRSVLTVWEWVPQVLAQWIDEARPLMPSAGASAALWPSERGPRIGSGTLHKRFCEYRDALGLDEGLDFHSLRRVCHPPHRGRLGPVVRAAAGRTRACLDHVDLHLRVLGFPDPDAAAGAGRDGGRGSAAGTERVMAASRQVSYQWRLREVMAAAGLFNASDLEPLLAGRGITLSSVQVWRLVTQTPERLSLPVLAALCDIFDVTPAQLIATRAENVPARRHAASGGGKDGVTDLNALRPARAKLRPGP